MYKYRQKVINAMYDLCKEGSFKNNPHIDDIIKAIEGIPLSCQQNDVLDKIYDDIQELRGCSCSYSDGIIDDVEDILDKYKIESEE